MKKYSHEADSHNMFPCRLIEMSKVDMTPGTSRSGNSTVRPISRTRAESDLKAAMPQPPLKKRKKFPS